MMLVKISLLQAKQIKLLKLNERNALYYIQDPQDNPEVMKGINIPFERKK